MWNIVDISHDYSTDGFLQVLRRFSSFRGWPAKIVSDQGSQLVSASKELRMVIEGLNWEDIRKYGHRQKTLWIFSPPDAPWYNGTSEALIKTVKSALNGTVGDQLLNFSEMQTIMMEVAQLVNQRPIGIHTSSPEESPYLSPNDLILGRSSPEVPQGPFLERTSFKYRFDFIQKLVNTFWKRWVGEVFPKLLVQPKWHVEKRDLKSGDVVLMQDSNMVRGEWKLALVKTPIKSKDGKVRRVILSYKRNQSGESNTVERPVQRLIVLVPVDDT